MSPETLLKFFELAVLGLERGQTTLVAQHCDSPYRAMGYSYTYRIYILQGIAGYRAIPPPPKGGYRTILLML